MIIPEKYYDSLHDFLEDVLSCLIQTWVNDQAILLADKEYAADLLKEEELVLRVYRLDKADITLSDDDSNVLKNIIAFYIFEVIRSDEEIDNPEWLYNILTIWKMLEK